MNNIVLIGMPGSGKSTIGVLLAKKLAMDFIDTDILIQNQENRPLQEIMDTQGYIKLREIEAQVLTGFKAVNAVVATGGSAPYSQEGMDNLRAQGTIVFLNVSIPVLNQRITDFETRGIAKPQSQSFEDLFAERYALYTKYAHITIDCDTLNQDQLCRVIIERLEL